MYLGDILWMPIFDIRDDECTDHTQSEESDWLSADYWDWILGRPDQDPSILEIVELTLNTEWMQTCDWQLSHEVRMEGRLGDDMIALL